MKQVVAQVISNTEVMLDAHLIWLEAPDIASQARPGQFVMVGCGGDTTLPRPLSIHQSDGNKIAVLFRVVGKGTLLLARCQACDRLNIFGPSGNGFSISQTSHNLLLIGGGIGIAPLHFLAQAARKDLKTVTMIYGAQSKNQLYPERRLPVGVKLITATDDGTSGHKGFLTDLIPEHVKQADQVFACGPLPMYRAMAQMPALKNKNVQVSLEVRMACGRGVCNGCTIKTKSGLKKVCEHGPVFNLTDVLWDELTAV